MFKVNNGKTFSHLKATETAWQVLIKNDNRDFQNICPF